MGTEFCCLEISCTPSGFQATNSNELKSFRQKGGGNGVGSGGEKKRKKDNKSQVLNRMSKPKQLHTVQISRQLFA